LLAGQQWGDRFHLLMQQREMGLPIDPLLAQDAELQTCMEQLLEKAPELFDRTGEIFRQSEHERSLIYNGYWITVVYDLLRLWRDRAEIVDWKTYLQPRSLAYLRQDWQTRLYLYVLVETTDFTPEQVAMTYWFVRSTDPNASTPAPQQVRIPYSAERHAATHQDLEKLTHQLTELLVMGTPFPQVPPYSSKCNDCPFAIRCQRGAYQQPEGSDLPDLDAIAEVVI
jgi:CRISPR/Cas system-associated exonuclease Cas4 (RecB family)